jgi:transketolase
MSTVKIENKKLEFGVRRGVYIDITDYPDRPGPVSGETIKCLDDFDLWYRTLCAILFNFASSGHPGGSVSSGHMVATALLETMDYNIGDPDQPDADLISYAAGHKALGLYAMWASRNEMVRISRPDILPDESKQLRLEDMLGFRRNPVHDTPLFKKFKAKPLDGHPTPLTPFLKIATGPSGVGVPSSLGMALGALDRYGKKAPRVHIIEGEGGMTPGRVTEGVAAASAGQYSNVIMHIDWNQASIDSDRVCREGDKPGDYVQWNPLEFFYLHDWNVIWVPDGFDFDLVIRAQKVAKEGLSDQPTAIVYKTVKGWRYGIEGKGSHGAGHKFCSPEYYQSLREFENRFKIEFPRLKDQKTPAEHEELYYETLMALRKVAESEKHIPEYVGERMASSKENLKKLNRKPRENCPNLNLLYTDKSLDPRKIPDELLLESGTQTTLRGELGSVLGYLNKKTNGGFIAGAADLLGSTSVNKLGAGFPDGFYNYVSNPDSRLISAGGICEDALGAIMTGLSSYGSNVGVSASYAAFIAALEHIAARVHCISQQARHEFAGDPFKTFIMICGHAGLKTGEDGPTHADPQALQLLQENFPEGKAITLVPWDPQELWPLVMEGLRKRPAVLAPFVTRPKETIVDRKQYNLPPATAAVDGVYQFRKADSGAENHHGSIILQGSAVTNDFVTYVLPRLDESGYNMNVYYVSSSELFTMLPKDRQNQVFPESIRSEAMGITGFTMPTMYRWVTSDFGRAHSLFSFSRGIYPGSGKAEAVLKEVGLNGPAQWESIQKYIAARGK